MLRLRNVTPCLPRTLRGSTAAVLAAGIFAAGCSSRAPTSGRTQWQDVRVGLCEDYPEETRSLAEARRDLAFAHASGAKVLRIAFGWDAMEPQSGAFDWSFWDEFVPAATDEYRIELIPYICYTPRWAASDAGENFWRSPPKEVATFARFIEALVGRYKGRIHSWELWNEPDNSAYWSGTREQFAELVKAGALAVRRSDPAAKVVLGGIATNLDFLEALFRKDDIAPAIDVVNFHSYVETWHPDPIESIPATIQRVAQIVRDYGEREPIWLAEVGYSSVGERPATSDYYRPHFRDEHTQLAQARALLRMLILANCSAEISTVAWYRIHDLPPAESVIGDDNNRHLGVLTTAGTEKPVARAFARLAAIFSGKFRVLPLQIVSQNPASPRVEAHLIATASNRHVLFVWNPMPGSAEPAEQQTEDTRQLRVTLKLRDSSEAMRLAPAAWWLDRTEAAEITRQGSGTEITLNVHGGQIAVFESAR